jgi:uncharacterized protein
VPGFVCIVVTITFTQYHNTYLSVCWALPFGSGFSLQVLIKLRFTTLYSGLSTAIPNAGAISTIVKQNRIMQFQQWISQPWPWYVSGPLIGLMVPVLLLLGNKHFGISSSLRHICAACLPAKIPFFQYNWKKEIWNLVFVTGVFLGGFIAAIWLNNAQPVTINPALAKELSGYGIINYSNLTPVDIFNWANLFTIKGFIIMVMGGFMVGFGTRYAGGCTSGHAIMGLSNLQLSSLIATICFMAGGFVMANYILPFILTL